MEEFKREIMLIGNEGFERLQQANVLIFGIGGVGGYVCESLARSGIGSMTLVDHDIVSLSNINRQIIALHSTVGEYKVDVMKQRIFDINPSCKVNAIKMFYLPENQHLIDFSNYDYIIDCIDTISAKLNIIEKATEMNIPVISSMGAGNRFDATKVVICDIFKTSYDPLAKVMRHELKKRKIKKCKVAFSIELASKKVLDDEFEKVQAHKRSIPGSSAFVPAAFGLAIAGAVVFDLLHQSKS